MMQHTTTGKPVKHMQSLQRAAMHVPTRDTPAAGHKHSEL